MTSLIIVESPNKAKKINEMFAGRFHAIASYGHICDLPASPTEGIGINRESMLGLYELTNDKSRRIDGTRVIAGLQQYIAANKGIEIYLGTDEDREGESIAAFIMKYLKLSNPLRMRFNAITKEKIELAFDNANPIDWYAVNSREARRLIDRIIGYVASPYLAVRLNNKKAKAGRVQTAVEALVIERERRIRNHKPQKYYTVELDMGGWVADWQTPAIQVVRTGMKPNSEFDVDEVTNRCFSVEDAKAVADQETLTVISCKESIVTKLPPSPLYTISMIQLANRVFDWDAEKTMQIAQKLFEGDGSGHGHITYHRTDSPNIDQVAANEIRAWLAEKGLPIAKTPNQWECKNKSAQEGHEAIRPSYFTVEEAGATEEQKALYRLIRERAIYSQLAPAIYSAKSIELTDYSSTHKFKAYARSLKEAGWLATAAAKSATMKDETSDKDEPALKLPDLVRGVKVNIIQSKVIGHTTTASKRYTMNTLTSKLENLCIGRPATIATLLKNVQSKGTILLRKDKTLEATKFAEEGYDVLYPRFAFSHIGYTAELEQALDQVASGNIDGQALARNVWDRLDADCQNEPEKRGDHKDRPACPSNKSN